MQLLPLTQANHAQLNAQVTRNLENPQDIDAISIEVSETRSNTSDSSSQDILQALVRIETTLRNNPHTGVTEQVLSYFIGQLDEFKGRLAQQNQVIETSTQQIASLEKNLEAEKQENAALKQKLQAKEEKNIALKNWKTREKRIHALINLSDWPIEVEQHIAHLFNDSAWEVVQRAALLLGPRFSPIQLQQHIIPLLEDPEWRVRQAAVTVLGQRFSSVQVEQLLITLLSDEEVWQVRKEVVTVLGQHLLPAQLEKEIIPLLKDVAWQDVNWEVQEAAAERLGTLGILI